MRTMILGLLVAAALPFTAAGQTGSKPSPSDPAELFAIDRVWSGHRIGFALEVTRSAIVVAYYDANRQLTVARRPRNGTYWTYHKLDCWTGWDSHNSIALAVDTAGQVHVVANLHNDPLVYFRTAEGDDVRSFERIAIMVDPARERRMTYPVFLRDATGQLILKYRDGGSGAGNEIYNRYDSAARVWTPLLSTPLVDGEDERNAYFVGPTLGPDGFFHLAWVWRETPAAETNHDLSYARSRDLTHWERSDGQPLTLPIKLSSAEIVDPVPVESGMINNNTVVGFDTAARPIITYHKFDGAGHTQIYVARREENGWRKVQVSDWLDFRWDFSGNGSLTSRLLVSGAEPVGADRLKVSVIRDGAPIDFLLDAGTLARLEEIPGVRLADRLALLFPAPPEMVLNTQQDQSGIAIAWPTLPPNRDLPRPEIPDPTILRLVIPRSEQLHERNK